jgi:DNA (cytosine-5)-methyltransferase 1
MSRAYYNEIEPAAAHVLRALIADGVIALGDVDTRSITEVSPDDLKGYTQCHFFAGGGLWSVAARLAGWPDDKPIWSGSCPCQPFSVAGKGAGTDDPRHLWPHFFRLIRACRPLIVVGEQVAGAAGYGWFDGVRADLARENYASRGVDIPACAVDAPHIRQRLYWCAVADADSAGWQPRQWDHQAARHGHSVSSTHGSNGSHWSDAEWIICHDGKARRTQSGLCLLVDGLPGRVGLWRLAGNAIVAPLAAEVIGALMDTLPAHPAPERK